MIPTDIVFDAYLDANILLAEAFALWLLACIAMRLMRVRLAHSTQLWLLNGVFLTVMLSPLVVAAVVAGRDAGLVPGWVSLNLTDYLLALFLNGRIDMAATDFEQVLSLRDTFTRDVARFDGLLGQTIAALLCFGAALFTAQTVRNVLRLRRTIGSSYIWRRTRKVDLRLSDSITIPFSTRGPFRRHVVVPSALLARPEDLRIVLQHEFQHLRQSDIEWEIALECLRPFFFWNPVFAIWKRRVEELREIAVDRQVLSRHGLSVEDYGGCLLRVCQDVMARRRAAMVGPAVGFINVGSWFHCRRDAATLKRRISAMLEREERPTTVAGLAVLTALVAAVCLSALAIQKPAPWSHDRLMLATVVNLERLDAINASGMALRP